MEFTTYTAFAFKYIIFSLEERLFITLLNLFIFRNDEAVGSVGITGPLPLPLLNNLIPDLKSLASKTLIIWELMHSRRLNLK
ncbi:hypothetical protein MANES_05G056050v8 [Manihot esculenta]|uniref:Uncharacterized protein n=1 Tax=Manihot esculenta TaxID=3983 RepID=A0ACB7HSA5_MANES|nr:hypothetical protein MANES_05G056050v8 [Manihot esculenta]